MKIAGKSLDQWDQQWRYAGSLDNPELADKEDHAGIYMARYCGRVVYVGLASSRRGLKKRLRDYTRFSGSSRKFPAGQRMNSLAPLIGIYVITTGRGTAAAAIASALEVQFIAMYSPDWNLRHKATEGA